MNSCPENGPPPSICSERVLHYTHLNDCVSYSSGHGLMFVGGKEIGWVPCLAICQADKAPHEVLLFYCDQDWNVIGVSAHDSVAAAKSRAERMYSGSSTRWSALPTISLVELDEYRKEISKDLTCSFCGKTPDRTSAPFVQGTAPGCICRDCIAELYGISRTSSSRVLYK